MMLDNNTTNISPDTRIGLAFLMSLFAFSIMLGNAVVIIAFVVDKNLRHRSNYFFLNLAISDFLVVILVSESWKKGKTHCEPGFLSEWYILVITSILEFLVPVFSVAYFNMSVYLSIWKRGPLSGGQSHTRFSSVSSRSCGHSCRFIRATASGRKEAVPSLCHEKQGRKSSLFFPLRTQMSDRDGTSNRGSLYHSCAVVLHQREHLELLRARKLARSLALLLGVFIICWAPYSLFTLIRSIYYSDQHLKPVEYEVTFWLQWFNSLINPVLYPLCHKHFQKTFLKILCIKKQSVPTHNRPVSS
ncbi:histamine H4 receptor isoform X2 [Sorex araneus]|uniref:histamine H4 receptor isoform X2 n=1 Tax=Sorex araneus TaxID=42254 RepID=UPI00243384E2|nr:histamine H4 receptor isoform X2 [Sorex araneus]